MTDQDPILALKEVLTVRQLAESVPLSTAQLEKINHIVDAYLKSILGVE